MSCVIGYHYTITLSNDGVVHSFGLNYDGQLGLGHNSDVSFPKPILDLPKICQVSCGGRFTVCVDFEGFIWSFGLNDKGQLGTGNTKSHNVPQKILDIPPALSVACGNEHTLIITNDSDLWSCGNNFYGQLCLGNKVNQTSFQHTSFSNISKVSLGGNSSLFQSYKEEIYACGYNISGELGLGFIGAPQITPILIPNLPLNIVQFICGYAHILFLDAEGNVFSVGNNVYGQLGLGHKADQKVFRKIPNIPSIQTISCVCFSSYLIDFEGNVWGFGENTYGQLGLGDTTNRTVPTKIESLKDIQQISSGSGLSANFLAKDLENKIFVVGYNDFGQLGTGNKKPIFTPQEMKSKYFTIWGDMLQTRAKSARK